MCGPVMIVTGLLLERRLCTAMLTSVFSKMQCVFEDGHAETRICHFQDILLHKGKILYLYQGTANTY